MEELDILGTVASIETDLFKPFYQLTTIKFNLMSLVNFFHRVGLEWIRHLNADQTFVYFIEKTSKLPKLINPGGTYTYPDRDLCIFSPIPLINNSVVPILISELTVCTETISWLTQNYRKINQSYLPDSSLRILKVCENNNQTNAMNMPTIETKIKQCLIFQDFKNVVLTNFKEGSDKIYIDFYDVTLVLQFVNDLLEFIIIPFACILGLLLNLRVVYTVHKNSKVELKEDFYKFMMINSVFNCIFCIIYAFYPINYCQQYENGYFCSTVYNTVTAQVIKIVFQAYFGEVVKMCSNISYIFITISRSKSKMSVKITICI
jgi:hypothetical protein